jgi:hypothetical protein
MSGLSDFGIFAFIPAYRSCCGIFAEGMVPATLMPGEDRFTHLVDCYGLSSNLDSFRKFRK